MRRGTRTGLEDGSYERLVTDWQLDRDEAILAITWVVGLVE